MCVSLYLMLSVGESLGKVTTEAHTQVAFFVFETGMVCRVSADISKFMRTKR